jgi:hypothetical protein
MLSKKIEKGKTHNVAYTALAMLFLLASLTSVTPQHKVYVIE